VPSASWLVKETSRHVPTNCLADSSCADALSSLRATPQMVKSPISDSARNRATLHLLSTTNLRIVLSGQRHA
jgi:hypothetical protein